MPVKQAAGLRLRPLPELGACLAFTPSPPRLHRLNVAAWLIAELCAHYQGDALREAFVARSVPPLAAADADRQFEAGLTLLLERGIVTGSA